MRSTMRSITAEVVPVRPCCSAAVNPLAQAIPQLVDRAGELGGGGGLEREGVDGAGRSSAPWMITASSSAPSRWQMPSTWRSDSHWLAQSPARCQAAITSAKPGQRRPAARRRTLAATASRCGRTARTRGCPTSRASASLRSQLARARLGLRPGQPDARWRRRPAPGPWGCRSARPPPVARSAYGRAGVGVAGGWSRDSEPHVAGVGDPGVVTGRQRAVDQPVERRRTALGCRRGRPRRCRAPARPCPSVSVPRAAASSSDRSPRSMAASISPRTNRP